MNLRQRYRIALLAVHVAVGLALSGPVYGFLGAAGRAACFGWWSRRLLRIAGVRVTVHGSAPATGAPTLVVSNHVSWLDVFVIRSRMRCRFVAKSEIRGWPLVGWLVARQDTVFVVRARRHDTSRVNAALEDSLRSGDRMVLFAEGMTTDGSEVKPFHGSLLQPVTRMGGYALPVAIRYRRADGTRADEAAYAGSRTLWESALLITGQREIQAELFLLDPVHAVGRHRRDLAEHCAHRVADALGLPRPERRRAGPQHEDPEA